MMKAAILTVDDDQEVVNAIERDLRWRYRSDYRILKATSGPEALDTIREQKGRNGAVALFLVDERMPRMSGTQFLIEALKLYPDARRVLLTAYADSEAAIAGINTVGLDHYLMKPWDPPEEHLYPVLDEALADWAAACQPYDGDPGRGLPLGAAQLRDPRLPPAHADAVSVDRPRDGRGHARAGRSAHPGLRADRRAPARRSRITWDSPAGSPARTWRVAPRRRRGASAPRW
ncbi:MAG: response regulator [Gemmatimonadales bacterium]